eukprot:737741-Pelagomonas_calceolata.AAC.1
MAMSGYPKIEAFTGRMRDPTAPSTTMMLPIESTMSWCPEEKHCSWVFLLRPGTGKQTLPVS